MTSTAEINIKTWHPSNDKNRPSNRKGICNIITAGSFWRDSDYYKKSVGKRSILKTESNFPLGRSAHSLVARGQSLYIFLGYGSQGLTFNDLYVLRNFLALAGLDQTKNMNYLISNDPHIPFLIPDNSNER